jgi:hypothetical protein
VTEVLNETTGELTTLEAPEPEPVEQPEPELEPEPEGRCEAETTAGGKTYRCALQALHEGDHAFTPDEAEPPSAAQQAKAQDKARERLAAEAERHRKRLSEIMGEDADLLIPCDLCSFNLAGWRFEGSPDEETINRVRVVLGLPDLTNYAPSHWERTCDNCRGLGKVRTGSTVGRHEILDCGACDGKGYVVTRPRDRAAQPAPPEAQPSNGEQPDYGDGVKRDMFGTPETDPDYNLMPNVRRRPTDYWQTHRV